MLLIPLQDYQRIFRVIFAVLDGLADRHKACVFFAIAGAAILSQKYKLHARPRAGAAALVVSGKPTNVVTFARLEGADLVSDEDAFHCWIECNGCAIDFMAPIYNTALHEIGYSVAVPARMFQRPLDQMATKMEELTHEGAFRLLRSEHLEYKIFSKFLSKNGYRDLVGVCQQWYVQPPEEIPQTLTMQEDRGKDYTLRLDGPEIVGAW